MKKSRLLSAVCASLFSLITNASDAAIIADSVQEFSGIQGQDNWTYGYYSDTFNPSGFQEMGIFNPVSAPDVWVVDFDEPSPIYWTLLNSIGGHPNGTSTPAQRDRVEHWAVRRWTSEVNGLITMSGNIADLDPGGGAGSNGVAGRIFVGDAEIFSVTINNGDSVGFDYTAIVNVTIGTTIDFVIDPLFSNDSFDSTRFTAQVEVVPVPAAVWLFASGLLGLVGISRRKGAA